MGICNDHSTILLERNLEAGLNTLHNLIIDNGDLEVVKEQENQLKVKNFKNEMGLKLRVEMQNNAEKISVDLFKKLVPEKYLEHCVNDSSESTYQGDATKLLNEEPVKFSNGSLYWGTWNDKCEIEGPGKLYMPQYKVYVEGIWKTGILSIGKILYPNGSIYVGEIKNSVFHGQGKLIYPDESIYEGEFEEGLREGRGSIEWPDGSKYWGEFKNDQMSGDGELIWSNGYNYKGSFECNKLEGKGILTGPNRSKYNGMFTNNMFNGQGRFNWGNVDTLYQGSYSLGKKNGKGKYKLKQGQTFKGAFVNGKPHGPGEIITDFVIYKGFWRNGELIEEGDKRPRDTDSIRQKTNESNVIEEPDMQFEVIQEDINPLELLYLDNDSIFIDTTSYEIVLNKNIKTGPHKH